MTKCYLSVWTPHNSNSQTDHQGKKDIRKGKLDKIGKHVMQWTDVFESMKYRTQLTTMPKRLWGVWTVLVTHSAYVDGWLRWRSKTVNVSLSFFFIIKIFYFSFPAASRWHCVNFKYQIVKICKANLLYLWNFSYSVNFPIYMDIGICNLYELKCCAFKEFKVSHGKINH